MHADVKARRIQGRTGPEGKAVVAAVLERGGKVRAKVVDKRRKAQLDALVTENVEPKSALYSDALKSYEGLSEQYAHQVIDHAVEYVRENVHTNHAENFWSLLKRGINGTYVSVEPSALRLLAPFASGTEGWLTFRFGPLAFASTCFRYSASRYCTTLFGTDMTRSTRLVKRLYSAECFIAEHDNSPVQFPYR